MKEVTVEELNDIIETRLPLGLFWCKDNGIYIACDNQTGDAWTEDFENMNDVITYLNPNIMEFKTIKIVEKFKIELSYEENRIDQIMPETKTVSVFVEINHKESTYNVYPTGGKRDFGFLNRRTYDVPMNLAVSKCITNAIEFAQKTLQNAGE